MNIKQYFKILAINNIVMRINLIGTEVYKKWDFNNAEFRFSYQIIDQNTISLTIFNVDVYEHLLLIFKNYSQNQYKSYLGMHSYSNELKILLEENRIIMAGKPFSNVHINLITLNNHILLTLL